LLIKVAAADADVIDREQAQRRHDLDMLARTINRRLNVAPKALPNLTTLVRRLPASP
jgi:hypothetical protein